MFIWNCVLKVIQMVFPTGWAQESEVDKIKAQEELELTKRGWIPPRLLMRYTIVVGFWILVVIAILSPFVPELKSVPGTYSKIILGAIAGLLD